MASNKSKFLLCLGLFAFCFQLGKAQSFSFSDLFDQGAKDIKNMEAQIAALNAFEASVRQGYNMLHNEWTAIGNWKNGEFNLHQNYYSSLSTVNPVIKNSLNVADVETEQRSIITQFNNLNLVRGLLPAERTYVSAVAQNVVSQCNNDWDELQKVLNDSVLQMGDNERLKRISQLTGSIKDKYLFTCHFCMQVQLLAAARLQETDQIATERSLYGIH